MAAVSLDDPLDERQASTRTSTIFVLAVKSPEDLEYAVVIDRSNTNSVITNEEHGRTSWAVRFLFQHAHADFRTLSRVVLQCIQDEVTVQLPD